MYRSHKNLAFEPKYQIFLTRAHSEHIKWTHIYIYIMCIYIYIPLGYTVYAVVFSNPSVAPEDYSIVAGTIYRESHSSTAQERTVTQVITHEHYDDDTYENDIALLKVSPLTFNDAVRAICIPKTDAAVGTTCVISGWGNTVSSDYGKKFLCLLVLFRVLAVYHIQYGEGHVVRFLSYDISWKTNLNYSPHLWRFFIDTMKIVKFVRFPQCLQNNPKGMLNSLDPAICKPILNLIITVTS